MNIHLVKHPDFWITPCISIWTGSSAHKAEKAYTRPDVLNAQFALFKFCARLQFITATTRRPSFIGLGRTFHILPTVSEYTVLRQVKTGLMRVYVVRMAFLSFSKEITVAVQKARTE